MSKPVSAIGRYSLHGTGLLLYFGERAQLPENIDFLGTLTHDLLTLSKDEEMFDRVVDSFDHWKETYYGAQKIVKRKKIRIDCNQYSS